MGWSYMHREPGQTTREFMSREFGTGLTIVDSAMVGSVWYAAARIERTGAVTALVVLTARARGTYNFGYKDMSESMGPCYHDCPARILDRLTPTDSDYANEWRAACRAKLARPMPVLGDRVTFAHPLTFTGGDVLDTFVYAGGNDFRGVTGGRYRITGWKDREFTVTRAAAPYTADLLATA